MVRAATSTRTTRVLTSRPLEIDDNDVSYTNQARRHRRRNVLANDVVVHALKASETPSRREAASTTIGGRRPRRREEGGSAREDRRRVAGPRTSTTTVQALPFELTIACRHPESSANTVSTRLGTADLHSPLAPKCWPRQEALTTTTPRRKPTSSSRPPTRRPDTQAVDEDPKRRGIGAKAKKSGGLQNSDPSRPTQEQRQEAFRQRPRRRA